MSPDLARNGAGPESPPGRVCALCLIKVRSYRAVVRLLRHDFEGDFGASRTCSPGVATTRWNQDSDSPEDRPSMRAELRTNSARGSLVRGCWVSGLIRQWTTPREGAIFRGSRGGKSA